MHCSSRCILLVPTVQVDPPLHCSSRCVKLVRPPRLIHRCSGLFWASWPRTPWLIYRCPWTCINTLTSQSILLHYLLLIYYSHHAATAPVLFNAVPPRCVTFLRLHLYIPCVGKIAVVPGLVSFCLRFAPRLPLFVGKRLVPRVCPGSSSGPDGQARDLEGPRFRV